MFDVVPANRLTFASAGLALLVCTGVAASPGFAAERNGATIPIFTPDSTSAWVPDRPTGDDFLPPSSGPARSCR